MQYTNLHTHTVFSDGTCTPEEMAQAAIEKNMLSLGFSDHSPMDHDLTYCVKHQALPAYCREIRRLKEKYKDQIEIALGLEMDSLTSSCDFTRGYRFHHGAPLDAWQLLTERQHLASFRKDYADTLSAMAISSYNPMDPANDYTVSVPNKYTLTLIGTDHQNQWIMGEDEGEE